MSAYFLGEVELSRFSPESVSCWEQYSPISLGILSGGATSKGMLPLSRAWRAVLQMRASSLTILTRDMRSILNRVETEGEVIIERDARPVAVVRPGRTCAPQNLRVHRTDADRRH
jgi:hypothetical protein